MSSLVPSSNTNWDGGLVKQVGPAKSTKNANAKITPAFHNNLLMTPYSVDGTQPLPPPSAWAMRSVVIPFLDLKKSTKIGRPKNQTKVGAEHYHSGSKMGSIATIPASTEPPQESFPPPPIPQETGVFAQDTPELLSPSQVSDISMASPSTLAAENLHFQVQHEQQYDAELEALRARYYRLIHDDNLEEQQVSILPHSPLSPLHGNAVKKQKLSIEPHLGKHEASSPVEGKQKKFKMDFSTKSLLGKRKGEETKGKVLKKQKIKGKVKPGKLDMSAIKPSMGTLSFLHERQPEKYNELPRRSARRIKH
jgi:hypothetical protein